VLLVVGDVDAHGLEAAQGEAELVVADNVFSNARALLRVGLGVEQVDEREFVPCARIGDRLHTATRSVARAGRVRRGSLPSINQQLTRSSTAAGRWRRPRRRHTARADRRRRR